MANAEHFSKMGRMAAPGALLLLLGGCSGGLPEMPSMPSLSALAAEAPSTPEPAVAAPTGNPNVQNVSLTDVNSPGPLGDRFIGKANAPVTIVEYASLTCPVCSKFQAETLPKLKKAYIDKGKVKLVYREFPIGRSAAAAALAVRCVAEKDYFKAIDKFYATQASWTSQEVRKDEIFAVAKTFGMKREKFDACLTDQKMNDALVNVKQRGRGYGVAGTPTFYVNGTKLAGGVTFEQMQTVIDGALATPTAVTTAKPQAERTVART